MPEEETVDGQQESQATDSETAADVKDTDDGDASAMQGQEQNTQAESFGQAAVPSGGQAELPSLPDFSGMLADAAAGSIEMLNDVELDVKIELGRAEMTVNDILRLSEGAVVELDKLAGDPVDVLVNEELIARGEILVVNDNFCVRINEIVQGISQRPAESNAIDDVADAPTPGPSSV